MDYFYGAMWLIIGLILIFSLSKENKIFRFIGAYFLFMGAWWIANAALPDINLFDGVPRIIFTVISVAVLVVIAVFYYNNIWKTNHNKESGKDKKEDK